jgi:hypothetical protein
MKTNLSHFLCLVLLLTAACSRSPQEKAIATIVHHLERTLKDPSSYIPVQYDVEEILETQAFVLPADSSLSAVAQRDTGSKTNPGHGFSGWKILHKFKCRSESGMVKDTQLTFYVSRGYKIEKVH